MNKREQKYFKENLRKCATPAEKISLYYDLASRLYDEDRHAEALPLYEEALKLEKSPNGKAYFLTQIGISHYFLQNDSEAAACLGKAKRYLRPHSQDFSEEISGLIHYYLGAIYAFRGKPALALKEQLAALPHVNSLHRENRWLLHTAISRSYEQLGRNEEAISYNQIALDVISDDDPNLTYLYESMGANYFELGQFDEALKAYQKILNLNPKFERRDEVYSRIASCYQNLTNFRSALDAYNKILEVKQLTGTKQPLGWLYAEIATCQFRIGDFAAALETARKGLKLRIRDPQEKAHLLALAAISLFELGSEDLAIGQGEKALSLSPQFRDVDQLLFRLALAYHKLGDVKSFRRYRIWCSKSFPDNAWNRMLSKLG